MAIRTPAWTVIRITNVGRGAADRVDPEVNVDRRRPGQRTRYFVDPDRNGRMDGVHWLFAALNRTVCVSRSSADGRRGFFVSAGSMVMLVRSHCCSPKDCCGRELSVD
jgi:hypothetical protein